MKKNKTSVKILFLGPEKTGKTTWIQRWKDYEEDIERYDHHISKSEPTIGVDYLVINKQIQIKNESISHECEFKIFDASGQERFVDIVKAYSDMLFDLVVVCYDAEKINGREQSSSYANSTLADLSKREIIYLGIDKENRQFIVNKSEPTNKFNIFHDAIMKKTSIRTNDKHHHFRDAKNNRSFLEKPLSVTVTEKPNDVKYTHQETDAKIVIKVTTPQIPTVEVVEERVMGGNRWAYANIFFKRASCGVFILSFLDLLATAVYSSFATPTDSRDMSYGLLIFLICIATAISMYGMSKICAAHINLDNNASSLSAGSTVTLTND